LYILYNEKHILRKEYKLSVRATERLIGDLVIVTELPNSPKMIVQAIEEESKIITTVWFTDKHEYQEGFFPASAIDRVESKKPTQAAKTKKGQKKKPNAEPAKKGAK
jgi:hypothetical protein